MHSQVYKEEEEKENKDPLPKIDNNETKCHNSKRKEFLDISQSIMKRIT